MTIIVGSLAGLSIWLQPVENNDQESLKLKLCDKEDVILRNEPEKLLITKDRAPKTNRNKPKNKAEKLLKIRSCGKNEPKTKLTMLLKIQDREKTNRRAPRQEFERKISHLKAHQPA